MSTNTRNLDQPTKLFHNQAELTLRIFLCQIFLCHSRHWPDFQNKDDLSKLGAEAFAFVNFARFAVPLRIGLALGTTPWVQENIVDVFLVEKESNNKDVVDEVTAESETGVEEETEDEDIEPSDDGENKKASRFRIRSRVGNLMKRVSRRQKQDQDVQE